MQTPNIAEAATNMVSLLTPFNSEERHRVVHAAMTLLGEAGNIRTTGSPPNGDAPSVPPRAQAFLKQNGLDGQQLESVFQIEGDLVELIAAAVPGRTDKERTLNVYVLTGIARLLATGDPSFDDKTARKFCKDLGCYNETNHSSYMKDKGNRIAGSKETGWKLTAPGLAHGAALIKEVARSNAGGAKAHLN
jgi:hypothetical protein